MWIIRKKALPAGSALFLLLVFLSAAPCAWVLGGNDSAAALAALRDGFYDTAERAAAADFLSASDNFARFTSFDLLMSAYEHTKTPEQRLADLEGESFLGRPWNVSESSEDMDFFDLKTFWTARALSDLDKHDQAAKLLSAALKRSGSSLMTLRMARQLSYEYSVSGDTDKAVSVLRNIYDSGILDTASGDDRLLFMLDFARQLVISDRQAEAGEIFSSHAGWFSAVPEPAAIVGLTNTAAVANGEGFRKFLDSGADIPGDLRSRVLSAYACVLVAETNTDSRAGAVDTAKNAVSSASGPQARLDALSILAYVYAMNRDSSGAAQQLKTLISIAPQSRIASSAIRSVISVFSSFGDNAAVLEFCKLHMVSFMNSGNDAPVCFSAGNAASAMGNHGEAAAFFMTAAERSSDSRHTLHDLALFRAGIEFSDSGDKNQAVSCFRRLREETDNTELKDEAHLREAECLTEYDPVSAKREFKKIIETQSGTDNEAKACFMSAVISARDGDAETAIEMYSKTLNLKKATPELRASSELGIGFAKFEQKRYADALHSFEEAVGVKDGGPSSERAAFMRTEALFALDRDVEAYSNAVSFIETFPASDWLPDAYFWLGRYDFNNGDFKKSEQRFLKFCDSWPENENADGALLLAAYSQGKERKPSDAIWTVKRLAERYPDSPLLKEARFFQGEMLCVLLQFDSAALVFDDLAGDSAADRMLRLRALGRRGDCLYTLGADNSKRYSEAISCYREVLSMCGKWEVPVFLSLQAAYKIGKCFEKQGRFDDACHQYYDGVILAADTDNRSFGENPEDFNAAIVWYARAVLDSASIYENISTPDSLKKAESLLTRLASGDLPGASEAERALIRIRGNLLKLSAGTDFINNR